MTLVFRRRTQIFLLTYLLTYLDPPLLDDQTATVFISPIVHSTIVLFCTNSGSFSVLKIMQ